MAGGEKILRAMWGINGDGLVEWRQGRLRYHDPDELCYDDTIREGFLKERKRRIDNKELPPGARSFLYPCQNGIKNNDTSRFLGYPELPRRTPIVRSSANDIKSKYSFEEKFGHQVPLPFPNHLNAFKVSASVVSLTSFVPLGERQGDDLRLFTCSGFVIYSSSNIDGDDEGSITIVTSASLVCHADDDGNLKRAENIKIKVRFRDESPCYGSLVTCCLNYNIAFVIVKGKSHRWPLLLTGRGCLFDGVQVFAFGRHYLFGDIMIASGTTCFKPNPFDCDELMFSTCKITKCGIGGPLLDSNGELIGINFFDKTDTPYLPACLIFKCWYHVLAERKVMQPYFGWKLRVADFQHIHKLYEKHQLISAVAVDKVKIGSPADRSGICDGDIIVNLCGEGAIFIAECAAVLLGKQLHVGHESGLEFEVTVVRGEVSKPVRIYTDKILDTSHHDDNRWPLPKLEFEVIPPIGVRFTVGFFQEINFRLERIVD